MPSRILASFVPLLFIAASLAHAAKSDSDDCCPTGCPAKCEVNGCVARPNCPCPAANCCVAQKCQSNPNGCCAKGNCTIAPPAAPPVNSEPPVARRKAAPRVAIARAPSRGRAAAQVPAKVIEKPVAKPVETPAEQTSQAPAGDEVVVAPSPTEKPIAEKATEAPAEKTAPTGLEPITAEQLSMPPLGKPLPAVKAGVVESPAPRALYVMPATATNSIQKQSHNGSQRKSPAPEQKAESPVKRTSAQEQKALLESGVRAVRPRSEISPSRDPLPPPIAPEYSSIRRK
jgi:hypothetical protein